MTDDLLIGPSRDSNPHLSVKLVMQGRCLLDIVYRNNVELDMMLTALLDHLEQKYPGMVVKGLKRWAEKYEQKDFFEQLKQGNFKVRKV